MERLEFALICERGKATLGEGNSSVGDLLLGLLAQAGLVDIQSMLNDKTFALVPPYQHPDQAALRRVIIANADDGRWIWSREDAKRCFLAGGRLERESRRVGNAGWQKAGRHRARTRRRLHTGGGGIHYLISGRRPAK